MLRCLRLILLACVLALVAGVTSTGGGRTSLAAGVVAPSASTVLPPRGQAGADSGSTQHATVASVAPWAWPVRGDHRIVRPFIAPATQYSAGHRGIDIAVTADADAIYAPASGVVHFSGYVVDRSVLSISHAGGVLSSYEPVRSPLHAGDEVTRGERIGTVVPGHCSELCLHFGVRINGLYVSPMLFLGGIQRPILLPTAGPS